jgi:hypothetical protein
MPRREQMYKKRFAKWGFQRNSKHLAAAVRASSTNDESPKIAATKTSGKASSLRELGSMPPVPSYSHLDGLRIMLLTSVRTWSMSFFNSVQFRDGFLASSQQQLLRQFPTGPQRWSSSTREINFVIKLVIALLDRGRGDVAGRMARKAFLLVEDMLSLEGPALLWNLLELMHHMVALRHGRLFHMLLAHLTALANERMPETHPFLTMLRGLRGLVSRLTSAVSFNPYISPLPPPSPSSLQSSSAIIANARNSLDSSLLSRALPSV